MTTRIPPEELYYKTELCRSFEAGKCSYRVACRFAHGTADLRPMMRPNNYKTKGCVNFARTGKCAYGSQCNFIHSLEALIEHYQPLLGVSPAPRFDQETFTPHTDVTPASRLRRAKSHQLSYTPTAVKKPPSQQQQQQQQPAPRMTISAPSSYVSPSALEGEYHHHDQQQQGSEQVGEQEGEDLESPQPPVPIPSSGPRTNAPNNPTNALSEQFNQMGFEGETSEPSRAQAAAIAAAVNRTVAAVQFELASAASSSSSPRPVPLPASASSAVPRRLSGQEPSAPLPPRRLLPHGHQPQAPRRLSGFPEPSTQPAPAPPLPQWISGMPEPSGAASAPQFTRQLPRHYDAPPSSRSPPPPTSARRSPVHFDEMYQQQQPHRQQQQQHSRHPSATFFEPMLLDQLHPQASFLDPEDFQDTTRSPSYLHSQTSDDAASYYSQSYTSVQPSPIATPEQDSFGGQRSILRAQYGQ